MCDFGLSKLKQKLDDLNYSFCGSPDYISPEVIAKEGYNYLRDIFSLGILAYELLAGVPPFSGRTIKELYDNISKHTIKIPAYFPEDAAEFIQACLEKNQEKRLGVQDGIYEVMRHRFLADTIKKVEEGETCGELRKFVIEKLKKDLKKQAGSTSEKHLNEKFVEDHKYGEKFPKFFNFQYLAEEDEFTKPEFPLAKDDFVQRNSIMRSTGNYSMMKSDCDFIEIDEPKKINSVSKKNKEKFFVF